MAAILGKARLRLPIVLGRRKNSTSGDTRYAKKIDSTSSRIRPVILEITQIIPSVRRIMKTTRNTARFEGPGDLTTSTEKVSLVGFSFTVRSYVSKSEIILGSGQYKER